MEALRLNQLSLAEVESVKSSLPAEEYQKLTFQLTLQRRFIEASIPHIEAFLRYRSKMVRPSADNRAKLEAALAALENQAGQVEALYKNRSDTHRPKAMRRYVAEVREAVKAVSA